VAEQLHALSDTRLVCTVVLMLLDIGCEHLGHRSGR